MKDDLLSRWWLLVEKGPSDACWPWKGRKDRWGRYGQFRTGPRKIWPAHRWGYAQLNGQIPEGLFVCHMCDNPICCNPKHLFLGTPKDNVADMVRKGRVAKPYRAVPTDLLTGEVVPVWVGHTPSAKMTWPRVRALREDAAGGASLMALSRQYGISRTQVRTIVDHKAWREEDSPVIERGRPSTKLTREDVIRLRQEPPTPISELSRKYGVSHAQIQRILKGRAWKWI